MRLLILTQKVDIKDPVLGFFHRWLEEFAKHCESVIVICLEKGEYSLPEHVKILSLGKEAGGSRLRYVWNFYKYIWRERKNYDKVFVHMNPEYVVLGGLFWRLFSKKICLWYTHKSVNFRLRLASFLANEIFSASKESFRLKNDKLSVMGHGIDVNFFRPDESIKRGGHWLSVGRLTQSKGHDRAIKEALGAGKEIRIAGTGSERNYLEELAKRLGADVKFLGPLSQSEMRDEYRIASLLVHRSKTGSLDKVVLEAAACGCPVDSTDPAIAALALSPEYVRDNHSLEALIPRLVIKMQK